MEDNNEVIVTEEEKIISPSNEIKPEDINIDRIISPGQLVLKRFLRNKLAIIGIGILVFMFIFSFLGPLFIPYSYSQVFINDELSEIRAHEFPSWQHLFGLDTNGMDILTRMMYGGRISLRIGFIVISIELLIGVILGGIAGFYGRWVDGAIMRLVDIFNCVPFLPIMLIVGAIVDRVNVDKTKNIYILMLVMGLLGWTSIARLVRGQILSLREQEFMVATEAVGLRVKRRIFKHLIPNIIPQLIVIATMGLGSIILTEAALSFLGFGVRYPVPSWGNIINSANQPFVLKNYWFTWFPAGLFIFSTVLAFNFVGDGLRDAFDPKMKR